MDSIARILTVVAWGGVCALLFLLYRIAHFFQVTSRQTSHYQLFLIPLALLLASGLWYAFVGDFAGNVIGDTLQLLGGAVLIALGVMLVRMMTGDRK